MRKDVIHFMKWAWVAAVVIFIAFLVQRRHAEFLEALQQIHVFYLFLSFIFILAAKVVLPLFMQYVVQSIGKSMDFWTCFRIYSITQLGKYMPGNIWHFVGKAAEYKSHNFSLGNVRDALVIENAWLVLSAFVYGLLLVTVFEFELIKSLFTSHSYLIIFFIALIFLVLLLAKNLLKINFKKILSDYRLNLRIVLLQLAVWTLLGLGFAVLAMPFLLQEVSILMLVGLYAVAFSIGFITPFAPAGVGVREAILALGLLPYVPLEIVIIVSVANRLLYLLVEIILASVACLMPKKVYA